MQTQSVTRPPRVAPPVLAWGDQAQYAGGGLNPVPPGEAAVALKIARTAPQIAKQNQTRSQYRTSRGMAQAA